MEVITADFQNFKYTPPGASGWDNLVLKKKKRKKKTGMCSCQFKIVKVRGGRNIKSIKWDRIKWYNIVIATSNTMTKTY